MGLDNSPPASDTYRFPVGTKVCGGIPWTNQVVNFNWYTDGTDNGTNLNNINALYSQRLNPDIFNLGVK